MKPPRLPAGWVKGTLGDVIVDIVGGGTPSRKIPSYFEGAIPWFTVKDLKHLRPTDSEEHISEAAAATSTAVVPAGTVIVATRIAPGRAVRPTVACAINQDLKALFFGSGVNPQFMLYWLNAHRARIREQSSGTTVVGIRLDSLRGLPILIPPAAEQTRIVERLEIILADIEDGERELQAAVKKLPLLRDSLLRLAFEGGLSSHWSPRHNRAARAQHHNTTARDKHVEASIRLSPSAPGDVTDMPDTPDGWMWVPAEQICKVITKGTTPLKRSPEQDKTGIPFLRVTNLTTAGAVDLTHLQFIPSEVHRSKLARSVVYPDDVLMNIVGPPLGQVAVVPGFYREWNINQAVAVFRPSTLVLPQYLCFYLLSHIAQRWLAARSQATAGQVNLSLAVCRRLPVPIPGVAEQQLIVDALHLALQNIDYVGTAVTSAMQLCVEQRLLLFQAAFSGRLTTQRIQDEPAQVLLDQTLSERTARQQHRRGPKRLSKQGVPQRMKLKDVLIRAGDWVDAQDAFRLCGIGDNADLADIERVYAELRELRLSKQLLIEPVLDGAGRKMHDRLKVIRSK